MPGTSRLNNTCTMTLIFALETCPTNGSQNLSLSVEQIKNGQLKEYIENAIEHRMFNDSCLIVSTISSQKAANRVLREMGFSRSPWMQKGSHSNTKGRLWWLPLTPYREVALKKREARLEAARSEEQQTTRRHTWPPLLP